MSTHQDAIAERIAKLQLTDTLPKFSPQATISPKTLKEVGAPDSFSARALVPMSTSDLPRISVDMRLVDAGAPASPMDMADLKVLRVLGEGGMGRVLLAQQRSLGREVAMKTLKAGDDSPQLVSGLLREARLTGALEHPGIVPVHALGLDENKLPILVMKRIEGVSLRVIFDDLAHPVWQTLLSGGTDRLEAGLRILMRVCEALAFAHSRGVLHCDIKPDNIMVGGYGEVYLSDWGVAVRLGELHSLENAFVGTPAYMAPEMLLGEQMGVHTDVYLLGATLHHLLTGRPRHEGQAMNQILNSVASSEPVEYDAHVPTELAELCNRTTSKDHTVRPASAEVFRNELAEYLRKRSAAVLSQSALERLAALEAALAGPTPDDLAPLYRHANEARFGFDHALRIEKTLETAQLGRQRTLGAMFDLELRQGHIESAAALLHEMRNAPEALEKRLSEARNEAGRRRAETEKLRAIVRELDPSIEARSRIFGTAMVVSTTFGVILVVTRGKAIDKVTNVDLILFALVMSACCIGVFGIFRRRLLTTLFNRRIAAFICLFSIFILLNRIAGWQLGQSTETILGTDSFMAAGMMAMFAVLTDIRVIAVAVWFVGIRIWMAVSPELSPSLFTLSGLGASAIFVLIWRGPKEQSEKVSGL